MRAAIRPDLLIAYLAAAAVAAHVLEAMVPGPGPWFKLGLANIFTLLAYFHLGWSAAVTVSLIRVVAGSLALGTFLSPTFFMSFFGAFGAVLVMGVASCFPFNLDSAVGSTQLTQPIDSPGLSGETLITNKVTAISPDTPDESMDYAMHALPTGESRFNQDRFKIGPVGLSILASLAHMVSQVVAAWLLIIGHDGIFLTLPWLLIGSWFTGLLNGLLAFLILTKIAEHKILDGC
jgi:heptaprenyl diphosphate synthase